MQDQRTTKWCRKCDTEKPRGDFHPARSRGANRDGLQTYCKACAYENAERWRKANLERNRAWQRESRAGQVEKHRLRDRERYLNSPAVRLTLAARDRPCVDCGIQLPPAVMELDHVRGTKSFGLGGPGFRERAAAEVAAEIAKCDVRCPNCHRLRHHREREREMAEMAEAVERRKRAVQLTLDEAA